MKTIAVVQARLGSTRLPGKVLADLAGQPLLRRVIDRVRRIPGMDEVILATTALPEDQALASLASSWSVPVFAGSRDDVLDRYYQAVHRYGGEVVIRVTADCPLLDPEVSGRVVRRYHQGNVDYVSNTRPAMFPDGLDTEVFSFSVLARAWKEARLQSEREHVTPYVWKNPTSSVWRMCPAQWTFPGIAGRSTSLGTSISFAPSTPDS